jgi:hypothetical protein
MLSITRPYSTATRNVFRNTIPTTKLQCKSTFVEEKETSVTTAGRVRIEFIKRLVGRTSCEAMSRQTTSSNWRTTRVWTRLFIRPPLSMYVSAFSRFHCQADLLVLASGDPWHLMKRVNSIKRNTNWGLPKQQGYNRHVSYLHYLTNRPCFSEWRS